MKKVLLILGILISLAILVGWSKFIGDQIPDESFVTAYLITPLFLLFYVASCALIILGVIVYVGSLIFGNQK